METSDLNNQPPPAISREKIAEYLGRDGACCGFGTGLAFILWGTTEYLIPSDNPNPTISSLLISFGLMQTCGSLALRICHGLNKKLEIKEKKE